MWRGTFPNRSIRNFGRANIVAIKNEPQTQNLWNKENFFETGSKRMEKGGSAGPQEDGKEVGEELGRTGELCGLRDCKRINPWIPR